jgi:hypothetical protein
LERAGASGVVTGAAPPSNGGSSSNEDGSQGERGHDCLPTGGDRGRGPPSNDQPRHPIRDGGGGGGGSPQGPVMVIMITGTLT